MKYFRLKDPKTNKTVHEGRVICRYNGTFVSELVVEAFTLPRGMKAHGMILLGMPKRRGKTERLGTVDTLDRPYSNAPGEKARAIFFQEA